MSDEEDGGGIIGWIVFFVVLFFGNIVLYNMTEVTLVPIPWPFRSKKKSA